MPITIADDILKLIVFHLFQENKTTFQVYHQLDRLSDDSYEIYLKPCFQEIKYFWILSATILTGDSSIK